MCGSMVVLKKKRLVGAFASGFTSSPWLFTGAATSFGEGATILKKFIMRCTAIFFSAEAQKTGNRLRSIIPL